MSIFMSSGEASGDHYTAKLAAALRKRGYDGELWGMGAAAPRDAGIRCEWQGERLQLLGLTEIFSSIPFVLSLLNEMTARVMDENPEAVVVADSPDFHMRLISRLRKKGYKGKIFYVAPPSVWAWRRGRAKDLKANVDFCLPLQNFEHSYLQKCGCPTFWIGHPMLEEFDMAAPSPLEADGKTVAFFPGSRASELKNLLPVMEESAALLSKRGWRPVFSVAPGLASKERESVIARFKENGTEYYEGPGRDLMTASVCGVAASGTIAVEALLSSLYMVMAYKVNPFSAFVGRAVIKIKYFTLANLIAGEEIYPELFQEEATAEKITSLALEWLDSGEEFRAPIRERMESTKLKLGRRGAYDYWARLIMEGA